MIDEIIARVLENWSQLRPNQPRPQRLIPLLYSRNRVVIFLFDVKAPRSTPLAIVKVSRSPKDNQGLQDTVRRLQTVRARISGDLLETVPETLELGQINGLNLVVQTPITGNPITPRALNGLTSRALARDCRAFGDWLLAFSKQTADGYECITDTKLADRFYNPLQMHLNTDFQETNPVWLDRAGTKLLGMQLGVGWRYGDAHPSNILLQKGKVSGVVDWEGAESETWPLLDWFHFTFLCARECYKRTYPSSPQTDLNKGALLLIAGRPSCLVARVLQSETENFLRAVGLDPDAYPSLLLLFLLQLCWPGDKTELIKQAVRAMAVRLDTR